MKIGWVGLGVMGGRIAVRLAEAGHEVVGWNRTASKARWPVEHGVGLMPSPRAVAEVADVVFVMVTNAAGVEAVLTGPDGVLTGLRPGTVVVDMSTISPRMSQELAERVREAGGVMLDCPVSGGVHAVAEGQLSLMVGGDPDAYQRVVPILSDIGRVTHVGGNGQALILKIAINLSLVVQMIAFSEGVLLAEKSGLPREVAVDVMLRGAIASPMLKQRAPAVLDGGLPDPAWFDCNMMQKDLQLALALGRDLAVTLPTTSMANELMTTCRGMGLDRNDFAVVFHVLAGMAGLAPSAVDA